MGTGAVAARRLRFWRCSRARTENGGRAAAAAAGSQEEGTATSGGPTLQIFFLCTTLLGIVS